MSEGLSKLPNRTRALGQRSQSIRRGSWKQGELSSKRPRGPCAEWASVSLMASLLLGGLRQKAQLQSLQKEHLSVCTANSLIADAFNYGTRTIMISSFPPKGQTASCSWWSTFALSYFSETCLALILFNVPLLYYCTFNWKVIIMVLAVFFFLLKRYLWVSSWEFFIIEDHCLEGLFHPICYPWLWSKPTEAGTEVSGQKISAIFRDPKKYSGQDFKPT